MSTPELLTYSTHLGFLPYTDVADVRIGDIVIMADSLERPGTMAAFGTTIVEDITTVAQGAELPPTRLVHMVRTHCRVSKIGICGGTTFVGTERWVLEITPFIGRYVRFNRGYGEADNRRMT